MFAEKKQAGADDMGGRRGGLCPDTYSRHRHTSSRWPFFFWGGWRGVRGRGGGGTLTAGCRAAWGVGSSVVVVQ